MNSKTQILIFVVFPLLVLQTHAAVNLLTCTTPSKDDSFCLQCISHYHLFNGNCYMDITGCQDYFDGNICRKCQNGYILVNNECCDRVCMSKIPKDVTPLGNDQD